MARIMLVDILPVYSVCLNELINPRNAAGNVSMASVLASALSVEEMCCAVVALKGAFGFRYRFLLNRHRVFGQFIHRC
jgi:hypothetical protein